MLNIALDKGSIVAEGTPLELKNKFAYDMILIYNIDEDEIKMINSSTLLCLQESLQI